MEVMVDPVIDMQGIAYEKKAILQWLSHHGVSPVSRQPLNSNLLVPNIALRDTIHEIMGSEWVIQRTEEVRDQFNGEMEDKSDRSNCDFAPSCKYRGRMQCYLTKLSQEVGGGMELELDDSGVCMFSCENMTIVVEVPADAGLFYIYTVVTVPTLSEESKDMMLELNRLQSETRKLSFVPIHVHCCIYGRY
jgi:U-box domain